MNLDYLILYVTSKCNAKCKHCYAWQRNNQNTDLETNDYKTISHQIGDITYLSVSGGEPFLQPDITDIITEFIEVNGVKIVNIPTNGFFIKTIVDKTEILCKIFPNVKFVIVISLDGLAETHNKIRQIDVFDNAIETFKQLKTLNYANLSVGFTTCITNHNYKELYKLAKYVETLKPNFHAFEPVRGVPREKNTQLPPLSEYRALIKKLKKTKHFYGSTTGFIRTMARKYLYNYRYNMYEKIISGKMKKLPFPCVAGNTHFVIEANGDFRFCELLPPVGNLTENTVEEIVRSPKALQQKEQIATRTCPCTHSCFQLFNIQKHFKKKIFK